MDRILTKIFYFALQVFKLLLIKFCKIQSIELFILVVFISFYISRYHFLQVLELHSTLSEKKIFVTNFSFLTDSVNPPSPPPPSIQNLQSVTKCFCQCSLTYYDFSRLLCYDDAKKNWDTRAELILKIKFTAVLSCNYW